MIGGCVKSAERLRSTIIGISHKGGNMNDRKKEAISFFSERIKAELSDNLLKLVLFGSQAREDSTEKSDYDFLILLKNKNQENQRKIREIELKFIDEFDIVAACLVFEETEWKRRIHLPIGKNIEREGVLL